MLSFAHFKIVRLAKRRRCAPQSQRQSRVRFFFAGSIVGPVPQPSILRRTSVRSRHVLRRRLCSPSCYDHWRRWMIVGRLLCWNACVLGYSVTTNSYREKFAVILPASMWKLTRAERSAKKNPLGFGWEGGGQNRADC